MSAGVKTDNTGIIQVSSSTPIVKQQGRWPMAQDGTVCVSYESAQARTLQDGVGYDSTGRLIVDTVGPSVGIQNGIPLNAAGGLVCSGNAVTNFTNGLGFDSTTGLVCMATLGTNLFLTPNGPYSSGNWTATNLTETTGQLDPLGGSTASLMTDNATNGQHFFSQNAALVLNAKYLATVYFKPGTFTNGISFYLDINNAQVNVTSLGVASQGGGIDVVTNITSTTVGTFFKITFNFVCTTTSTNPCSICFGPSAPTYVGTGQTQTFWGLSVQGQN